MVCLSKGGAGFSIISAMLQVVVRVYRGKLTTSDMANQLGVGQVDGFPLLAAHLLVLS